MHRINLCQGLQNWKWFTTTEERSLEQQEGMHWGPRAPPTLQMTSSTQVCLQAPC